LGDLLLVATLLLLAAETTSDDPTTDATTAADKYYDSNDGGGNLVFAVGVARLSFNACHASVLANFAPTITMFIRLTRLIFWHNGLEVIHTLLALALTRPTVVAPSRIG
jgi:hypothetical protein